MEFVLAEAMGAKQGDGGITARDKFKKRKMAP